VDCGNSTWSGGELVCAHHGPVNPRGRYCEKFVAPSLGEDNDPVDDEEDGCEMFGVPGAADDEVCAVDCPDYEECKNEAAEKEEDDQDLPQEPEPVPEHVEIPLRKDEKPADFTRNTGVPKITGNHDREMFHGQMCGNSNGNITVRMGPKGAHTELEAIIAEAIGCAEGDVVPIAVDITRGAITIRRRGKF